VPPSVYLQTIAEPELRGVTNQDLVLYSIDLEEALRLANHDKEKLQEWVNNQIKQP
jgi:hypothetical protein